MQAAAPPAPPPASQATPYGDEPPEDAPELAALPARIERAPEHHPLDTWSEAELETALLETPERFGSLSIGSPSNGALLNGVRLEADRCFTPVDPDHAWGTSETLEYLQAAIAEVHRWFPGTQPLHVGHLSARGGGPLSPHLSHQSGRDVDVGYFYVDGARWYRRADAGNLDLPRTWAFVRALVTETDVEMILMDRSIQALMRRYAISLGEDDAWVDSLFYGKPAELPPIFRHARGHRTHLHVRFYNPIAQESARRLYPLMVKHEMIEPLSHVVHHRVAKGETLGKLAKRFGTTVKAIMRANGLHSTLIQARRIYKIPRPGPPPELDVPISVPERRLPPLTPAALIGPPKLPAEEETGGRSPGTDVSGSARN